MVHLEPQYEERSETNFQCEIQSDEIETLLMDASSIPSVTNTAIAEFLDETPGSSWSISNSTRSNLDDQQPQIDLANFLRRPVLIKTHVWAQADAAGVKASWYPWHLFFNSAPIKNKITNYGYISCTLKVKFVVNASPFYSGAMAFTYNPLQDLGGSTIIADAAGGEMIGYSQRPKVWVFPQTCQGGEVELPFFYHKNWLDITSQADVKAMGTITPVVYAPLSSATGITGTSIVVNIYAWAEDVKLHAPTIKLALQSSEFDYKPSQIASSVAAASNMLSRIPMIGPYMKATSSVASTFSSVASSFGFTNVPNMDTVSAVKVTAFPHNSSCEVSIPQDRSSVDPKNETTIDPRTVGLDGKDELQISYVAGKEAWLGNAILSSTDAVDALTLVSRVTPALMFRNSANDPNQYTPMAYLCEMFKHWRGDIIFRFKFICTRFHKGRVRITFDPVGDISSSVPDYTTVFNEVIDIGAEQDIEVRVPYMQATTYLMTSLTTGNYNLTGGGVIPNSVVANGLITMRVVNPLSGPVANTAIPVMVFVRAAENIEYAWPSLLTNSSNTLSPFALQSDEITYAITPTQVIAGHKVSDGDPKRNLIHFGERICSLRPLIHRSTFQYSIQLPTLDPANTLSVYTSSTSRRLKYPGFDPNGYFFANKIVGVGTAKYHYSRMNIAQLVSLLYIGQRGSMTWLYNLETNYLGSIPNVSLKRFDGTLTTSAWRQSKDSNIVADSSIARFMTTSYNDPNSGVALTDQRCQPGISMNFPYYSQFNFQFTNHAYATLGSQIDGSSYDNIQLQVATTTPAASGLRANVWAGCGPDYNFFFFINTPSLYLQTVPTSA